jgi:hypothetical protein
MDQRRPQETAREGIQELKGVLKQGLGWQGARMDCLARLIGARFKVKTVNLAQRATAFPGCARIEAPYQRLQRFFRGLELDDATLARLGVALLPSAEVRWVLTLDRTQWPFRRLDIHLRVRGIVGHGVSWPILGTVLPTRGHSHTAERLALLNRFLTCLGRERLARLLADRDVVGRAWFASLKTQAIAFRIRIQQDTLLPHAHGVCQERCRLGTMSRLGLWLLVGFLPWVG